MARRKDLDEMAKEFAQRLSEGSERSREVERELNRPVHREDDELRKDRDGTDKLIERRQVSNDELANHQDKSSSCNKEAGMDDEEEKAWHKGTTHSEEMARQLANKPKSSFGSTTGRGKGR